MSLPDDILFATSNPHKLTEVAAILGALNLHVGGLIGEAAQLPEPIENGATFEANAEIKARYYAHATGHPVLADDSGLVVDALNGAPGVHSARYCGLSGRREVVDPANNAKLLRELEQFDEHHRTARFVCAMVLCDRDGVIATASGTVEGHILRTPRGPHGFGYDPLFFIRALGKTTAELSPEEKNKISHRGQAARQLVEKLRSRA